MRKELSAGDALRFDIKQDPGGIADIEFLARVLGAAVGAAEYPPVAMFSDTIRQLESVASRTWCRRRASTCSPGPYREYRAATHLLFLEGAALSAPAAAARFPRHTCRRDTAVERGDGP